MTYRVRVGDRELEVELDGGRVLVDGQAYRVDMARIGDGPMHTLLVDDASHAVAAERDGSGRWRLGFGGRTTVAEAVDERTWAVRALSGNGPGASGPRPVVAPMPGMVVRVEVAEGDVVTPGQGLVIVEAMKMENELRAEVEARVGRVLVEAGQAVEKDQLLIDLGPVDEGGDG